MEYVMQNGVNKSFGGLELSWRVLVGWSSELKLK